MSSNVLKPYERIIINQRNKIRTLTNELIKMCQKYITSPYRIPNLLKQISQTEQFDKFTRVLGARFVNEVNTWNRVAFANYLETGYAKNAFFIYKGLSADNELKSFLAKQAEEKAKLFKSIPVDLANTIVPKIEKLTVQGATPKTVAYELAKDIPSLLEYQVKTIARTETSKTSVAITGFKSKKNNIPCYQWKASGSRQGDGRTRSSHCKMSDVIIFWEDPPAPEDLFPIIGQNGQKYKNTLGHYHAGCCPNCRCLASPVIFIDDLKFPVRVYTQGMIKTMTKKDFLALYNAKVGELKAENAQKKQLNQKPKQIQQEQINQQIKTPIIQNVQPIETRTKEEILKDNTKDYIYKNFPHIPKGNIYLDDFDEDITQTLNEAFVYLNEDIKPYMEKATGKKIEFTTINYLSSGDEHYKVVNNNWKQVELNLINWYKNKTGGKNPSTIWVQNSLKNIKKNLESVTNFYGNSPTRAFAIPPKSCVVINGNYGIYVNPDKVKVYDPDYQQWKPLNCNNFKSTIFHEIGHTIDYKFNLASNPNIQALYKEDIKRYKEFKKVFDNNYWAYYPDVKMAFKVSMQEAKKEYEDHVINNINSIQKISCIQKFGYDFDFLSQYSFDGDKKYKATDPERYREFIAEVICEIFTVGERKARPMAQKVWKEIIKQIKNDNNLPNKS